MAVGSPDSWHFNASNQCLYVGGNFNQYLNHGMFYVDYNGASDSGANKRKHQKEIHSQRASEATEKHRQKGMQKMEGTQYIFGHDGSAMILKTVGATHTDLSGHLVVVAQTDVDETTHTCDILRKYRSFEGADGTCYDVYIIGGYYCDTDRTTAIRGDLESTQSAANITFVALAESGGLDEVTASEHAELFAEWAYPVTYKEGQMRIDPADGCLYRVNKGQGHTSQQGWNPSLTPALWTKAADPAEEWPAWSQPIGKDDAYRLGAKVSHNGKHWTCTGVDGAGNNVWEPGVYGWTEVTE